MLLQKHLYWKKINITYFGGVESCTKCNGQGRIVFTPLTSIKGTTLGGCWKSETNNKRCIEKCLWGMAHPRNSLSTLVIFSITLMGHSKHNMPKQHSHYNTRYWLPHYSNGCHTYSPPQKELFSLKIHFYLWKVVNHCDFESNTG